MANGRGIDRRVARVTFGVLAAAVIAAVVALPSGAIAKKHHRTKGLALSFKSKTQSDQGLLSSGKVDVVVRSPHARKLVLAVRGFGGGPALTDAHRVSAKAGKKKKVSLPLSTAGREVVQGCGADSLLLTAKAPAKAAKKKKKKGKSPKGHATLTRSVPQCDSLSRAERCEIIASPGTNCLFPFPSDHYTVPDSSTPTGMRVNLSDASTPANKDGVHINPAGINTSDGFSPGESIVTRVPGLDNPQAFQNTGAVPLTDMDRAFDPNQPIVLIDASTGQRQLIFSELDSTATSPANTDLIIRPGRNLIEGHRYIVALRQPEGRLRRDHSGPARLRALSRWPATGGVTLSVAPRPLRRDSLEAPGRRDRPGQPLRRLGLHRRQHPEHHPADALDPRPWPRRPGGHHPGGRHDAGRRPRLRDPGRPGTRRPPAATAWRTSVRSRAHTRCRAS
jgi:hypothetical protein